MEFALRREKSQRFQGQNRECGSLTKTYDWWRLYRANWGSGISQRQNWIDSDLLLGNPGSVAKDNQLPNKGKKVQWNPVLSNGQQLQKVYQKRMPKEDKNSNWRLH